MLRWYGDSVNRELVADMRDKVRRAVLVTEAAINASMRKGGRTESGFAVLKAGTKRMMVDKDTGARAGKINTFRSLPGEAPRVQTGALRRSYTHEFENRHGLPIGRVGSGIKYSKWLEFGTRRMAPRPHVRPVLYALRGQYATIFGTQARLGHR